LLEVRTPCRLHFGLLALSPDQARQFGGVGLMVRRPDIVVQVTARDAVAGGADRFTASGPMADRAAAFAQRFMQKAEDRGLGRSIEAVFVRVVRAPRPHTGLGTGTQLGMAVARALAALIERDDLGPKDLAGLVGRGQRSAIGTHGFFHGGLVVEGGKRKPTDMSPMLVQQPFPEHWRIVLATPRRLEGVAGQREANAFKSLLTIPREVTAELCRLVMLEMLPAVIEGDLAGFGEALYQLQQRVGACFAPAQGGVYADDSLEDMVQFIRGEGIRGVGQSSWGPTLYAVTPDEDSAETLAAALQRKFSLAPGEILITEADNLGSTIRPLEPSHSARP
jgi:beta-ribofuranosylaminobenzene 5'-phosphate synthase